MMISLVVLELLLVALDYLVQDLDTFLESCHLTSMEMIQHLVEMVQYKITFQFQYPGCLGPKTYDSISIFPFFQRQINNHFASVVGVIKTFLYFS